MPSHFFLNKKHNNIGLKYSTCKCVTTVTVCALSSLNNQMLFVYYVVVQLVHTTRFLAFA